MSEQESTEQPDVGRPTGEGEPATLVEQATVAGRPETGGTSGGRRPLPVEVDRREVEWRFDAADLAAVEGWLGGGDESSGLTIAGSWTKEISDIYYDTEDWRIYRAGYALRIREVMGVSEATLKALASDGGSSGEDRRREVSEPISGGGVEALRGSKGPAGTLLRAVVGVREVHPVFGLRTRRQSFDLILGAPEEGIVTDASGDIRERKPEDEAGRQVVGEVALDSTEIPLGEGEEPARISRVEVEADAEDVAPELEEFVARMRDALGLEPTGVSKYAAALFFLGRSPEADSYLGRTEINDSLSLGELAFAVLRRQFTEMRIHEAGSRLGEDPEEVHDMRVAIRRIRAAIKLFEDALPARARHLRDELKWVAGALGDVRDLDVQLEQIEEWEAGSDADDQQALERASSALNKRREEARGRMIDALDSGRYERFESSFAAMLRLGPTRETTPGGGLDESSRAGELVLEAGPGLLSRRYRKWRKLARAIDDSSLPADYHELRKEGKRLRYALEFFAEVYGEDATDGLVKPLKKLQDDLGRHQDAIVAAERLRDISTGSYGFPPHAAFFMGIHAGDSMREAASVRENLRKARAFRTVADGNAWKGLEKKISKRRKKK